MHNGVFLQKISDSFMSITAQFQKISTLFIVLSTVVLASQSQAQCLITSTAGYQVSATICPQSIVVSSTDCPNGYNYNVNFTYNIQMTGAVQELYTLQTLIDCNSGQQNGYYSLPKLGGAGNAVTTTNPFINTDGAAYTYTTHPSCTQATVNNLHCVSLKLIIQGPGIPYQVIDCNCSILALPVEFIGFTGERKSEGNLLTWSTASENRNAYFSLETSTNGQDWKKFKDIPSGGNSVKQQDYSFLDEVNVDESTYYKLSQTDLDGTRNELAIVYIKQATEGIVVFPNPSVNNEMNVQVGEEVKGDLTFVLINDLGQIAQEWSVEESAYKANRIVSLESHAAKGVYQLLTRKNQEIIARTRVVVE